MDFIPIDKITDMDKIEDNMDKIIGIGEIKEIGKMCITESKDKGRQL